MRCFRTNPLPRTNAEHCITVMECMNNSLTNKRYKFALQNIEMNISTVGCDVSQTYTKMALLDYCNRFGKYLIYI